MLDFYQIVHTTKQMGRGRPGPGTEVEIIVKPKWNTIRRKDLMTRGGKFYGVWNPEVGLWSSDVTDVIRMVDSDIRARVEELEKQGAIAKGMYLSVYDKAGSWEEFLRYVRSLPDEFRTLDAKVAFLNTEVHKDDYISFRVPYELKPDPTPAFDELFGTLYDDENLTKIKWAIGSVIAGDSKDIQKFYALYGKPGTGKSTVLHLIEKLLPGHVASFTVGDLAKYNNDFAMEQLKNNPLVAIDHEGDLSRVESNSSLNSIVAHETVVVNAKFQTKFSMRINTAIFIATNQPIKITDTKSGLIRRLIDIQPTGMLVRERKYERLVDQLNFELGGIATLCLNTYNQLGSLYYSDYRSREMLSRTNHLFDFVQENAFMFEHEGMIKRSDAWKLYETYCDTSGIQHPMPKFIFKDQFGDYWDELKSNVRIDGKQTREVYVGFKTDVFKQKYAEIAENDGYDWLAMGAHPSIFDRVMADQPAQYVNDVGGLPRKWDNSKTKLHELDTGRLHMVLPPENLVMVDFDIPDKNGQKSLRLNIEAARKWPPTYAETSKSGLGIHLYYYYDGDMRQLQRNYAAHIEIKPAIGKFAIRRLLTMCNEHEIAAINSGLPLKPEGEPMLSRKLIANERAMRTLVLRNLAKEIHPHTKPSIDFIYAILQEGYDQGLEYDLTDMEPAVLRLAESSTNNAEYCVALVRRMKFKSDGPTIEETQEDPPKDKIVFFDVEVFPNVFILSWKFENDPTIITWYNPSRTDVSTLLDWRLIGFNNRQYDNHILFGWLAGDTNQELYERSVGIINNSPAAVFAKAYGLSYADVYNYSSVKQSLKKWQLDLGLNHHELEHPWDEPLPESLWESAGEYCKNDVISTEAVHHARIGDFNARKILAALSGLRINDSTSKHVQKIIFGSDPEPQSQFHIPDLSEEFPGYTFDQYAPPSEKSLYRGEYVGEGGYVWADPGLYQNVAYLDIASMHPASLVNMNLFGPYTKNFDELRQARILIKKGELEEAGRMFGGRLAPYLEDESQSKDLAYALKIALNSVYGYTSTQKYDWVFRHPDNIDNVVAKRGALFMVDLKNALFERGCRPVHFKTDSVKIADFKPEDLLFVEEFGSRYGYDFELEGIFERMALINDAVLIGKWKDSGKWEAVGARFAHPYVYKTLFSHEPIEFEDLVETRMVSGGATIYLEKDDGARVFIGRVGKFCPVTSGGGKLVRIKDDKVSALPGTKERYWLPEDTVAGIGIDRIDLSYFEELVEEAVAEIAKFGDAKMFLEGE